MWMAKRPRPEGGGEIPAEVGAVTIAGEYPGVGLGGERRNTQVFSPGGYHWTPRLRDTVLVVKAGEEGAPALVGRRNPLTAEVPLAPGEVWISVAPGSGVHLKQNGEVDLRGRVLLNGELLVMTPPEEEEEGTVVKP